MVWLAQGACDGTLLNDPGQFEITVVAPAGEEAPGQMIQASPVEFRPGHPRLRLGDACCGRRDGDLTCGRSLSPLGNLSLIFLMAVLLVAIRFGLWPSVYTSLLSFFVYNFFTEPHYTFLVERQEDVLTVVFFLVVAVIVGNLAARLKAQVEAMRQITRRTANLYDFSRKIAGAASLNDVLWAAVHHVASTLQCHSLVLLPHEGDRLEIASGYPPEDQMSPTAGCRAGRGSTTRQPAGVRHAAGLGVAVPAAQDRTGPARPAWRCVREPETAADAGAARPAGSAGGSGRGRDRADQPRDRYRAGSP